MSFVCPECGGSYQSKKSLYNHQYYQHGIYSWDPRITDEVAVELEKQSDLNLLRFLGPKLDKIRPNHRKSLIRLDIIKKKYFRSNGVVKFTYTTKGLALLRILEAET